MEELEITSVSSRGQVVIPQKIPEIKTFVSKTTFIIHALF